MVFFWRSSKSETTGAVPNEEGSPIATSELPPDLAQYLETRESKLSDREFKDLLRRQSEQHRQPSVDEQIELKQRQYQQRKNDKDNSSKPDEDIPYIELPHQPIETPREYINQDIETYRRQNDTRESVLVNCSEIQSKFYSCLAKQSVWDRLQAVGRLQSDECTALADFFVGCSDIQKKAFGIFDYDSLETVEEMNDARKTIDQVFNKSFKNIDQVRDRTKFNEYSKLLRSEREAFHDRYGK